MFTPKIKGMILPEIFLFLRFIVAWGNTMFGNSPSSSSYSHFFFNILSKGDVEFVAVEKLSCWSIGAFEREL